MINFIFMLTDHDTTVPNAEEVLRDLIEETELKHIGFKDVGIDPAGQKRLTDIAHEAGMTVYLEVVSTSAEDEKRSMEAGVAAGVDWIVGGTRPDIALPILEGSGIKFAPFPGQIVGHPSVLKGSIDEIAADAARLTAMDGVDGVDLLAYRHVDEDPIALTEAVVAASHGPVLAAGSVVSEDQVCSLEEAGATAYTIGGAIFQGKLQGAPSISAQVRTALTWHSRMAAAMS